MRIYLIRHGDPDYPNDSLTPTGRAEAQALAEHLAQAGIDEIYASPRGRAKLTAQYTADHLEKMGISLPVTIEPWTTELDGLRDMQRNRSLWDFDAADLRAPHVLRNLNGWHLAAPLDNARLAEHVERIEKGSDDFLSRLGYTREGVLYRFTPPNTRRIALFAHLGFGLTWLAHLLSIPVPLMWAGFYLHPTSVTTILFDERTPGLAAPRVLALGDVSHLHRAGLSPTPAGIIANYE